MPEIKVSALPTAATLDGSESVYVVQGGVSKKTSVDALQPSATESTAGKVELATTAEAVAGIDTARAVTPAGARALANAAAGDSVYVPASSLTVSAGAMTISNLAGIPAWYMVHTSDTRVAAMFPLPAHWTTFAIDIYWSQTAGGSGDVRWRYEGGFFGVGESPNVTTGIAAAVGTVGANGVILSTTVATAQANQSNKMIVLGMLRNALHAADTYDNSVALLGVNLRRLT